MSPKSLFALLLLALIVIGAPLAAQEPTQEADQPEPPQKEKTQAFRLSRGTTSAEEELALEADVEIWEPRIESGSIEVSFAFGFLGLSKTLWEHDQIIYKYTTDATYWGDVKIKGESAFNPVFRLGYNVTDWFSIEGIGGLSISEYSSNIENRRTRENKPGAPVFENPPLGEFDAERRSLITIQAGLNAVLYPLSLMDDAEGRFHPYVTAGGGAMWYNMNSNYMDKTAMSPDFNFGGGIRLLADRNISVRFEILMHMNKVQFDPAENFLVLNEGTTLIPINEYPIQPDGSFVEQPVKEYSSQTLSLLNYSIGVHGSF
jgi:hypothetical protein